MMELAEKDIIKKLIDLREKHHAISIKIEFEDEGASFEEASILKEISNQAGLDLTIKIGGCGALNDIRQTKRIGADTIVAPMIETAYALKKFTQSFNTVYSDENLNKKPQLFINIETNTGYKNFDEIISIPEAQEISGIVVGRFDMAKSIGLGCKDIHSDEIFEIVNDLASKTQKTNKIFAVGGGVRYESLDFFNRLPQNSLLRLETRKIVFDANPVLKNQDFEGILKAIEFELMWVENKQNFGLKTQPWDLKRIEILKKRCETIVALV